MKGLFSGQSSAPLPAAMPANQSAGGWVGLGGGTKLAILSSVAIAVLVAVMWPSFNSPATQQPANGTPNNHAQAQISDYQPPAPTDVVNRLTGASSSPGPQVRVRPMPTEMALYAVTAPPSRVSEAPSPGQAAPAGYSPGTGSGPGSTEGLPQTNRATIVRNPDYLIRPGDAIQCLPVQPYRSDVENATTCETTSWQRSSNGRRGLLPPKTRLFGHIRVGMEAGQERPGIVFSLVETKWFDLPIAAPASDIMGRGGLDANVQTFFWDRAGAVALYALLDAGVGVSQNLATSALSSRFGSGGTNFNFTGPGEQLASREFDHTINKPPLGTRQQAKPITVIVGQNLDAFDACQQAMRVDPMACPVMSQ